MAYYHPAIRFEDDAFEDEMEPDIDHLFDSAEYADDDEWTDADEAALEEYEIAKRQRIAEANEY